MEAEAAGSTSMWSKTSAEGAPSSRWMMISASAKGKGGTLSWSLDELVDELDGMRSGRVESTCPSLM